MPQKPSTTRQCAGRDVVALIPAAGSGSRIAPIPGSKEVFPIGFSNVEGDKPVVKVISQYLFDRMVAGGVGQGIIVLRSGKWDIPAYFGEGEPAGMKLSYVVVGQTLGPPDTLDRAYAFVRHSVVAFGFPDIMLDPPNVFDQLLTRMDVGDADVVLGMYDVVDPHQSDIVELDEENRVLDIHLKAATSILPHCWGCAVWGPAFTEFMHDAVQEHRNHTAGSFGTIDAGGDLPMGLIFKQAVEANLKVVGVPFEGQHWTDVGSPRSLLRMAGRLRSQ
jgi:glucose-1-phosphate thymidylyltransferase